MVSERVGEGEREMNPKTPVFQLGVRVVLDDCRFALLELKRNPAGEQWTILWVASCVLLRTVAEALFKVDMDIIHCTLLNFTGQ